MNCLDKQYVKPKAITVVDVRRYLLSLGYPARCFNVGAISDTLSDAVALGWELSFDSLAGRDCLALVEGAKHHKLDVPYLLTCCVIEDDDLWSSESAQCVRHMEMRDEWPHIIDVMGTYDRTGLV